MALVASLAHRVQWLRHVRDLVRHLDPIPSFGHSFDAPMSLIDQFSATGSVALWSNSCTRKSRQRLSVALVSIQDHTPIQPES